MMLNRFPTRLEILLFIFALPQCKSYANTNEFTQVVAEVSIAQDYIIFLERAASTLQYTVMPPVIRCEVFIINVHVKRVIW